jgi:hypothetical protein
MELQNSSKIIDISLYYKTIDEDIFNKFDYKLKKKKISFIMIVII